MPAYIPTIGLEVHVQLNTRSKMFCGCPVEYGAQPNSHVCPVCLGYPGALPAMNGEALKMTALAGLMLGCEIAPICKFDRKNYFYPDMPKNYQITQFDLPICIGGGVPLHEFAYPKDAQKNIANPGKVVRLTRIHLEEDVAKSTHFDTSSGIDFNRAGTPLMEIVSEPDIATPEEAFAYLTSLQQILIYGGVSDADMEKGQLRCDCNVSVRPEGQKELGVKIEIKNMNSISAVRRAVAYEIERQTDACQRGETLVQSTRGWDDATGQTRHQRTKESSHDYRYFPDPDLLPVDTTVFMTEVRAKRPELPGEKRDRFVADYGVTNYDASVLASEKGLAEYFDTAAKGAKKPKNIANWIINDLLNALSARRWRPGPGINPRPTWGSTWPSTASGRPCAGAPCSARAQRRAWSTRPATCPSTPRPWPRGPSSARWRGSCGPRSTRLEPPAFASHTWIPTWGRS